MKMYEHYEVKDRVIWNHISHLKMYEPCHVWITHINHMWHDMSRHGWVVLTHVRFFEAMQAGADRLCFCQSVMEHTHTHAHAHTHTHTHTHTHIYTYIHTRIHTHADTHIHTHVHNFTHTHAHTRTHTQTHTHTLLRQKFCVSYSLWERVSVKCVVCPSLDLMAFFFLFFFWNVCVPLYLCDGICELRCTCLFLHVVVQPIIQKCHFFILKSHLMIYFSRSLLAWSVEKRPRRLKLEIVIKWLSKCDRL